VVIDQRDDVSGVTRAVRDLRNPSPLAGEGRVRGKSSSLQLPASGLVPQVSRLPRRAGLSLVEVLISMFVLLVGLMGVAAMIPAGRHEILEGAKVDHATAVGRAAYRDLKIRGYLNPRGWSYPFGAGTRAMFDAANPAMPFRLPDAPPWSDARTPTPAVCIDPLGLDNCTLPARSFGVAFPFGATAPSMVRIYPDAQMISPPTNAPALADLVFRNGDDLIFNPNPTANLPPVQQMFGGGAKRGSEGNYSWMATLASEYCATDTNGDKFADDPWNDTDGDGISDRPFPSDSTVTVSVAVFYKRNLVEPGAGEAVVPVTAMPGLGIGGGEATLNVGSAAPKFPKGVRPGQWLMLAGIRTIPLPPPRTEARLWQFRWYRVVAADTAIGGSQNVSLQGADWTVPAANTQAFLFEGIVAVYEKSMRLEIP
jgi:hypothetical protein